MVDGDNEEFGEIVGRKKEILLEFAKALKDCQSVQFVAIVKSNDAGALYHTGGHKEAGPTLTDMARAIGALAHDLTVSLQEQTRAHGQETEYQIAARAIGDAIEEGLNASFKVMSGKHRIVSDGDRPAGGMCGGPAGAPRGF